MKRWCFLLVISLVMLLPAAALAALPLITDDSETQGRGKFQLELGGSYDHERETETGVPLRETDYTMTTAFTYGILDPVDIFIWLPVTSTVQTIEREETSRAAGLTDTAVGLKWRFFGDDKQGFSLAVRPGITIPTGNQEKGLGTGRVTYTTYLIATYGMEPWNVHMNLGYTRNENVVEDKKNLWHASIAATHDVEDHWKVCADVGRDTSRDMEFEIEPAYGLVGLIYSPSENMDISIGMKASLNKPMTDWDLLPGFTYHF